MFEEGAGLAPAVKGASPQTLPPSCFPRGMKEGAPAFVYSAGGAFPNPAGFFVLVDPRGEGGARLEVVRGEDARLGRRDPDEDRVGVRGCARGNREHGCPDRGEDRREPDDVTLHVLLLRAEAPLRSALLRAKWRQIGEPRAPMLSGSDESAEERLDQPLG